MNGWVCVGQHSRPVKHFLSMRLLTQGDCSVTRVGVTMLRERGGWPGHKSPLNDSIIRQQDRIGYHGSSFTAVKKKKNLERLILSLIGYSRPRRTTTTTIGWRHVMTRLQRSFPPLRTVKAFVTMVSMEFFTLLSSLHLSFSSVAAFMMSNISNLWVSGMCESQWFHLDISNLAL